MYSQAQLLQPGKEKLLPQWKLWQERIETKVRNLVLTVIVSGTGLGAGRFQGESDYEFFPAEVPVGRVVASWRLAVGGLQ